jgi:hypothetical protein
LIGILTDGAGDKGSAQVTAAVLLYRAVTYLPSIPLGALACLTWRYAPALISTSPRTLTRQARITATAIAGAARRAGPRRRQPAPDLWFTRSSTTSRTPGNPAGRSLS